MIMNVNKLIPLALCWMALLFGWQVGVAQNSFEITLDRLDSEDRGNSTIQLANGHLLIAGTTENGVDSFSGVDGFLSLINPQTSAVIWSRAYGWGNEDGFSTVIEAENGNIIVGGFANRTVGTTTADMWFLRMDGAGNILSSNTFHPSIHSNITEVMESDVVDTNGNSTFLVTGPHNNFADAHLSRLDQSGVVIWANTYAVDNSGQWTYALEEEIGGNRIYISGSAKDGASHTALLIQLNNQGVSTNVWEYAINTEFNCIFDDLFLTANNNIIATGHVHLDSSISGNTRPIFVRIDPNNNGAVERARMYNTTNGFAHRMTNFQPIFDRQGALNGFVANVANDEINSDGNRYAKILQLDVSGNVVEYVGIELNAVGSEVFVLDDNSYALVGTTNDDKVYLARTDENLIRTECSLPMNLTVVDTGITMSVPTIVVAALDTTNNVAIPNTTALTWQNTPTCCWSVTSNENYLRIDPENPDPRLADYGIIRTLNGARNFRIINSNYNRLPEHIYLADEVTLFVKGVGGTLDVTNADVVFGRNSGIYIEAGNELIANNAVFRPCDETQTWDGIVVTGNNATANFRECTFINPTFGVLYGNTTNGAVSGSLFLNAQHGIVAAGLMTGSISNNVFRVDDNAKNLTYSDLSEFGFNGLNRSFTTVYDRNVDRYNIQHSGVFYLSANTVVTDVIISQNEFVNAMSLGTDNPTFNGVLIASANGVNVSNNSFTNNDISVLAHFSREISIENNHMEVTRRSTSDASFYQVVTVGPSNSSGSIGSTVIIKGNTIVNSADVQDLTPNVTFVAAVNTNGQAIETLAGLGAIYNFGNTNGGHVRIEDNDISGFEIGIYTQGSYANNVQIVNNRIKSNLYGIYQGDRQSFIGCNEIEMDLDANVVTDAGVVGIRADILGYSADNQGVAGIFGNCVRNTDRAIFMESQVLSGLGWMHIQNNYLYNYTEAGLYSENFSIVGEPTRIRRNAFISNQPNGDVSMGLGSGAFDIVTENSTSIGNARVLTIDRNYFGSKGLMNNLEISTNGSDSIPVVLLSGDALKPFTSCGNMDVTSADTADFDVLIEEDWMTRCDNEAYGNNTPIAQRTSTGTQLNANYQTVLTDLMGSDATKVEGLLIGHIQSLTDLVDVEALYLTAQQLSLSTKTNNWIEYYYQERQGNHTAAQQVLNNMTTETTLEAEEVTVKKAQLDLVVRNARTLTDATLIADLKVIAGRSLGTYKHTAREILHNSTNESYTFQYNPVKLYTKPASVGTKPQVGNNTDIRISPNPATDKITVSIIGNKSVEWTTAELYDIHGRLLLSQPVNAYTMSFDLETLAQGVYVITLKGENGYQTTEKFVKQ
jgi:hypothetical protein